MVSSNQTRVGKCYGLSAVFIGIIIHLSLSSWVEASPIDIFESRQSVTAAGSGNADYSAMSVPFALGGHRKMSAHVTSGIILGALVEDGLFGHQAYFLTSGYSRVVWDGDFDPARTKYDGLGGLDLTSGGASFFRILIDSYDYANAKPVKLILRAYDASDIAGLKFSEITTILNRAYFREVLDLSYSSFTVIGENGPASFQNVGAVVMTIDGGSNYAIDLTLQFLQVCPGDSDYDLDGVNDCDDLCPKDRFKVVAGICGCGISDQDSDGDGVFDCNDQCPQDANKTESGICGCGVADIDSDGDEYLDCVDQCPEDANKVEPTICGCGVADTDSDSDGAADCNDACPADANKTAPGQCGCGVSDADSDSDGVADCKDACSSDADKTEPGICGCGVSDKDGDGDGTPDCNDQCPADADKTTPGQCGCGISDQDSDGDGVPDCSDNCPADVDKTEPGTCGCGVSDVDADGDGTPDCNDQCPADAQKILPGACGCGVADADSDSDGVADCNDACPADANKTAPGQCGCGVSDQDSDSDGVADCKDACSSDADKTEPGICGCGVSDRDSDGDGTPDCNDQCPADAEKIAPGVCGCGISDGQAKQPSECFDCAGVHNGTAIIDRCGVCGGDGSSCLKCEVSDYSSILVGLRSKLIRQRQQARQTIKALTRKGYRFNRIIRRRLIQQVNKMKKAIDAFPTVVQKCENTILCPEEKLFVDHYQQYQDASRSILQLIRLIVQKRLALFEGGTCGDASCLAAASAKSKELDRKAMGFQFDANAARLAANIDTGNLTNEKSLCYQRVSERLRLIRRIRSVARQRYRDNIKLMNQMPITASLCY